MPLNTNHHMICKYRSRQDRNYIALRHVLRKLTINATRRLALNKQLCNSVWRCFGNVEFLDQDDSETLSTWLPGSCQWILSDKTLISWKCDQRKKPTVLLMYGPPGCGKSVLSNFIAQHLKTLANHPSCFFSVPSGGRESVSPGDLLKSLANQLSQQSPAFRQAFVQFAQRIVRFDHSSWYPFWEIFVECLLSIEMENIVYWVIDGIDQCQDLESFTLALTELSATKIPLRILVVSEKSPSSHPFNKLREKFEFMAMNLSSQGGIRNDLRLVVTKRVECMRGIDDLKQEIINRILSVANGNFLCADLLYQEIRRCRRKEKLRRIMNEFQQGLTSYYQIMEMELKSRWTEDDQDDARVIMPWLLCAFHPLTIDQIHNGMQCIGVEFIDLELVITRVCGRFVTIDSESRVKLVHRSARQFISAQNSVLSIEMTIAQNSILMSCLQCFDSIESNHRYPVSDLGFPGYAMRFWYRHLEECDGNESVLSMMTKFFKGCGTLAWIFLVSSAKELQHLTGAALALNRFILKLRRDGPNAEAISFLEVCAIDLYMISERFSGPLLSDPAVIFELVPLFCPSKSFPKQTGKRSKISIDGFPDHEWDNYTMSFTLYHACRGSKVVSTDRNFAVSTSTQEGLVLVYDMSRTSPMRKLVHQERVTSLRFNHSTTILVTYGSITTKIWDISTGHLLHSFTNTPDTNVLALTFTRDDQTLLAFCDDYILRKGSLNGCSQDWVSVDLRLHDKHGNRWINPSCAAFDNQGILLSIGFANDPIEIWDLLSCACISRFGEEVNTQTGLKQLEWSPRSDRIIARQQNGSLFVLDISHNEIKATCADITSTMACNPTAEFLVTGDRMGIMKVRRISDLTLLYQIQGSESIIALSVAPNSGMIYDIHGTNCTVWEPSLLARTIASSDGRHISRSPALPLQAPSQTSQFPSVTAFAPSMQSSTYCTGYADGCVVASLHGGKKIDLNLPTKMRIERLLWSNDGRYLAVVDLAARVLVTLFDPQTFQFQTLIASRLDSSAEQLLFNKSSRAFLVVTEDNIVAWDLDEMVMTASRHNLGSHSCWITHPTRDNLLVGFGSQGIEIRQWHDLKVVSGISLNNYISELTFSLGLLDYVKNEPSAVTIHPSLATCKVKKILVSPDASMILLVTTRETKESISDSQFLLISVTDLDSAIMDSRDAVRPIPLIESLSDIIAMPLGLLSGKSSQGRQEQLAGGRLLFLSKENWICSAWVNTRNEEHPVQRHIFLPSDWLKPESVELAQVGPDEDILIPKSEHLVIIRNALDVQF